MHQLSGIGIRMMLRMMVMVFWMRMMMRMMVGPTLEIEDDDGGFAT